MPLSFSDLIIADPSPQARRLLWHVLSVGRAWRDEPEERAGTDKAGMFLFYVVRGSGVFHAEERKALLRPGRSCWLADMRQARSYVPDGGQRLETFGIRFHGPALDAWRDALGTGMEFAFQKPEDFARLRRDFQLVLKLARRRPANWEWHVHETIHRVLGRLAELRQLFKAASVEEPEAVRRVIEAVLSRPRRDWQAAELAHISGVSYSRLRDLFRTSRSETLHGFLQRTRMDEARRLLADSQLTVKEVAERLDFSSEFYFSHFFRRMSGLSPRKYRQTPR